MVLQRIHTGAKPERVNSHLTDVSNFTLRRKYQSNELENQILEERWYFRKDTKVFVETIAENP